MSAIQKQYIYGELMALIAGFVIFCATYFAMPHLDKLIKDLDTSFIILPATTMFLAIAKQATYRFFHEGKDDAQTAINQRIIQNTVEQSIILFFIFIIWVLVSPPKYFYMLAGYFLCFFIGRLLFIFGYQKLIIRAMGFALTFLPACFMLLFSLLFLTTKLFT